MSSNNEVPATGVQLFFDSMRTLNSELESAIEQTRRMYGEQAVALVMKEMSGRTLTPDQRSFLGGVAVSLLSHMPQFETVQMLNRAAHIPEEPGGETFELDEETRTFVAEPGEKIEHVVGAATLASRSLGLELYVAFNENLVVANPLSDVLGVMQDFNDGKFSTRS